MATLLGKIKAGESRDKSIKLFQFIAQATTVVPGYGTAPNVEVQKIIKADPSLIEVIASVPMDANGNVAVRATPNGLAVFGGAASSAPAAPAAAKQTFNIESGIEAPAIERGFGNSAGRVETYPFSQLEVGQSFHIVATADAPEPWRSLASAVSSANRRFAVKTNQTKMSRPGKDGSPAKLIPVYQNTKVFTIRHMKNADGIDGARIFRMADHVAPSAPVAPTV